VGVAVWREAPVVVGAGRGFQVRGLPDGERQKESSRTDTEGAQTSENLNEMRATQAPPKSLILQTRKIMARHSCYGETRCPMTTLRGDR